MFSMDFEKFLLALGDTATVPALQSFYEKSNLPAGLVGYFLI